MRNVRQAESSILMGQARAKEALGKFTVRWFEPYTDMQIVMWWKGLSPFERAAMQTENPDAYRKVQDIVKGLEVKDASI